MEKDIFTLNKFLKQCNSFCKELKSTKPPEAKTIIFIGNQSADPDSICGCISLAYVSYMEDSLNPDGCLRIPVINLTRDDLHSRFESKFILQTYGVDIENLITLDEINIRELCLRRNDT